MFQETVIETRVVRYKQPPLQARQGFSGNCCERWRSGDHGIADAGQLFDEGRNGLPGIDQLLPLIHPTIGIDGDDADFGDAVDRRRGAGGLKVNEGKWLHGGRVNVVGQKGHCGVKEGGGETR